jgi:F420-non-reducing hydrogenase small subunit
MSAQDYGEVDIMMLTGVARTEDDVALLRQARQQARYIVAFGSCATFGGIPDLTNLHEQATLLETAYQNAPSLQLY